MLDQHSLRRIVEYNIGLRIPSAEFVVDFRVEVVISILRLPVSERDAQRMEQRTANESPLFALRFDLVLGNESEVVGAGPLFEQVLKCFSNDRLPSRAGYLYQFG